MKHPSGKPSDQIMRFFTPQLYLRFNSLNDEETARANEEWEKAIEDYRNHLNEFRDGLPSSVRILAEISLHDAEVVERFENAQSSPPFIDYLFPFPFPAWTAVEIMLLKRDGQMMLLIYSLWDRVRVQSAPEGWRFSKLREHWLYDEIEWIQDRRPLYLHRILFSTGDCLEIPFITAVVHEFPPRETKAEAAPKRSA